MEFSEQHQLKYEATLIQPTILLAAYRDYRRWTYKMVRLKN